LACLLRTGDRWVADQWMYLSAGHRGALPVSAIMNSSMRANG
jgi:hypothetical protein